MNNEIIGLNAEETYKAEKQLKIKELENEIITWRASIIYDDREIVKIEKHKEQMLDWIKECENKLLNLKDFI